jgi:UPF0755 protein
MKKIFFVGLLLLLLGVLGFTLASTAVYRQPRQYPDTTVVIAPGTGARGALTQLYMAGILPNPKLIALPLVVSHQYSMLKAGEYFFPSGLSPAQVIAMMAAGKVVVHKITVPEGADRFQVRAIFEAEPLMSGTLGPIAEGSVFPNTLYFTRNESRGAVLAKLQHERTQKLAEAWAKRDPAIPLTSPEQALVLASIVERETGVPAERAQVAGLFYNRLRLGMRLQSDPTAMYGIAVRNGAPLTRPPTAADMQVDTPYNTYTRDGLPPEPICNPGQAAIEAVLHPAQTDALYFVATGEGGHNFSTTLQSHTQNVNSYRKAVSKPSADADAKQTPAKPKRRKK